MDGGRIRARREQLRLPQQDLSALAGVSRQALGAIEAGRSAPSVGVALRIATALGLSVEELFGSDRATWTVSPERVGPSTTGRRVVACVRGKWIAHGLGEREHDLSCDGVATERGRRIELFHSPAETRANVIVMGCAPALGILCDRLNAERGPGRFIWLPRTSKEGIEAMVAGDTHIAGTHLTDDRGHEANSAYLGQSAKEVDCTLITLAHWEVGLVVARGNPKGVRRAGDIAQRGVRLVNRERGASPRRVLERRLRAEGVKRPADTMIVHGHRDVAKVIALGAADVGPSVRDVAISSGLDFVSFHEERFDLALPTDMLSEPGVRRLLDLLTSKAARAELSALGYDVRETGRRTGIANNEKA